MTDRTIDHAVVATIVEQNGKILLVRETKKGREGMFNVPGGHVESHETLFEAAIRETKEESGYDIELTGLLGVYQTIAETFNISGPVFSAKVVGGEATTSDDHPEVTWVTPDELYEIARQKRMFTTYPPHAVQTMLQGKALPLDSVVSDIKTSE